MSESVFYVVSKMFYAMRLLVGMNIAAGFMLTRRKHFVYTVWLNVIVLIFGGAFAFWSDSILFLPFNVTRLIYGSHYIGISLMILLVIALGYRGNCNEFLFVYVLGYSLECSIHGFSKFFVEMGIVEDSMASVQGVFINSLIFAVVYSSLYLLFYNKRKKGIRMKVEQGKSLTLFLFSYIFLIIYLRFELLYLRNAMMQSPYEWGIDIMLFVIPLIFFWTLMREVRVKRLNSDLDILKLVLEEKEKQYALTKENIKTINRKSHDLKRLLHAFQLASENDRNASLLEIEEAVNSYDSIVNTGSRVIDTVISENNMYCREHGIDLAVTADGSSVSFMRETDIYIMFDNLLVNAMEAVKKLPDTTRRHISITVKRNKQFVIIQSRNYYDGEFTMVEGLPETTKGDKNHHGFGLKSIQYTVEKYDGSMTVNSENGVFVVTLMLPVPAQ